MYNANSSSSYYHQAYDKNGYGGMAYYGSSTCGKVNNSWVYDGCTNSYDASEIKYVVDGWAQARFTQNQLKTVNDYAARLINYGELTGNLGYAISLSTTAASSNGETPSWVYNSKYDYWTMSQWGDSSSKMWRFTYNSIYGSNVAQEYDYWFVVRPVINVYKSKIVS